MRTFVFAMVVGSLAWTGLLWECGFAQAQDAQCGPHDEVMKALVDQFHEAIVSQATAGHGTMMVELTVSAAGTWTLIGTDLHGLSCIRAAGDDWTKLAEPPKPGVPS